MNVKVLYDLDFSAIIADCDNLKPVFYNLQLNLLTLTEDNHYHNIAAERISFFIQNILNGSILCSCNNPFLTKLKKLNKTNNVIIFPEEPYDQLIATILFHKLHAILEEKMEIDSIVIKSLISSKFRYTVEDFAEFSSDMEFPWWDREDTTTTDNRKEAKLFPDWVDVHLDWETRNTNDNNSTEILVEFEIDDTDVIVIDGGSITNDQDK